jgi:hypothetical protein
LAVRLLVGAEQLESREVTMAERLAIDRAETRAGVASSAAPVVAVAPGTSHRSRHQESPVRIPVAAFASQFRPHE